MAELNGENEYMSWEDIVWKDPGRMSGALCFRGSRVRVQALIDYLNAGHSLERFLEGFPSVEPAQARAYLTLSGQLADQATAPEREVSK